MLTPALAAVLPAGATVTEVVPRTGGQLSTVHEVRFADAEPVVVKRYGERWRWKQAKEVHVYRLLAEHGIASVPRVVHVDRERAATVLTLLPGRPLSEMRPGPDALRAAYRRMGELLAALHRIPQPAYGYLTTEVLDPEPDNPRYVRRQFAEKLAEFAALGGPPDLHDAVRDRVADQEHLLASCPAPVLCHNDLHEGNVLVDGACAVTGFVDVENAIAADPLLDLAKTVQYDLDASPVKRAGLLEGYGPLPPDGPARIELYRLYHALELWDWFASAGTAGPLPGIGADIRALAAGREPGTSARATAGAS